MNFRPLAGRRLAAHLVVVVAAAGLAPRNSVHAQFLFIGPKQSFARYHFFPADALIQTEFPGSSITELDHIVGFDNINDDHTMFLHPTSPTLNFIPNPLTQGFGKIFRNTLVFNESVLNIAAGGIVRQQNFDSTFSGTLRTYDKSTVNLTALGEIAEYYLFDQSKLDMTGGRIERVLVKENATATIDGGEINGLTVGNVSGDRLFGDDLVAGAPNATIKKGAIRSLSVEGSGSASMTGGTLGAGFTIGHGQLALSNINVPSVQARDFSKIAMSGGQLGGANIVDFADLVLNGTAVTGAVTLNGKDDVDLCTAMITGGDVNGGVNVFHNASATLNGTFVHGPVTVDGKSKLQLSGGAHLSTPFVTLTARDDAAVEVADGSVDGPVEVNGNASFVMKRGTIDGNVNSLVNGKVSIEGGIILGILRAFDAGANEIAVTGGEIQGGITITGSRTLVMTNAITSKLTVLGFSGRATATIGEGAKISLAELDGGDLNMLDGSINDSVGLQNNSTFTMGGGVLGDLLVGGIALSATSGMIEMAGGVIFGDVDLSGTAHMTMTDGVIEGFVNDRSKLTWSGGKINGKTPSPAPGEPQQAILAPVMVSDAGQLDIVGTGLVAKLLDPNFGGMFSQYELAGQLADGTGVGGVTFLVQNGTGASFQLLAVPEPGSLALAGSAMATFLTARRRGRSRCQRSE